MAKTTAGILGSIHSDLLLNRTSFIHDPEHHPQMHSQTALWGLAPRFLSFPGFPRALGLGFSVCEGSVGNVQHYLLSLTKASSAGGVP